jgi:hypothetical protein
MVLFLSVQSPKHVCMHRHCAARCAQAAQSADISWGKARWGVVTWAGSRKVCEVGGLQHDEMEVFWFVPSQCDMWMLALCRLLLTSSTVPTMMVGED